MDLSKLAAKQKRLQSWSRFVENEVSDLHLKRNSLALLERYRQALTKVWDVEAVSPDDIRDIDDLERQLEELNERARLAA